MDRSESHPLNEFQQNPRTHLDRLSQQGTFEVLTVDGEARAVVMSPQTFDALLAQAGLNDSLALIDRSTKQMRRGDGKELRKAVQDIATNLPVAHVSS